MLDKPTPPTPVDSPLSPTQTALPDQSPLNEDPDSHYVRTTYARLDVTGVRGDGYEEGIELTRARLNADTSPKPSAFPRPRRLEVAEIETLRVLDR
jgi:hypothetical protein